MPLDVQVKLETKVIDHRVLKVGENSTWGVTQNSIYHVLATLGNKSVTFHGFDPSRDKGFDMITFWLVQADGVWFGYDNTYWQKYAPWQSK